MSGAERPQLSHNQTLSNGFGRIELGCVSSAIASIKIILSFCYVHTIIIHVRAIVIYRLYNGQRDATSLLKWITQFLTVKVEDLNDHNLEKSVLKTDDIVLVDYYAPWCGHCVILEPQFAIAAQVKIFVILMRIIQLKID